jgi:hypothetical protein
VHLAVAACLRYDLRLWIQLNSDPGGQQQSARAATIDSKPIQQYVDGGGIQNHKVSRQGDTTFMLATAYSTQSSERSCSAPPRRRRARSRFRLPSASPRLDKSTSACAAIFDSQPNKRSLLSERSFLWKSHFHSIHYTPFICHPLLSFAICGSMQVTACLHDRQAISHLPTMQLLANF